MKQKGNLCKECLNEARYSRNASKEWNIFLCHHVQVAIFQNNPVFGPVCIAHSEANITTTNAVMSASNTTAYSP